MAERDQARYVEIVRMERHELTKTWLTAALVAVLAACGGDDQNSCSEGSNGPAEPLDGNDTGLRA